MIIKVKSLTKQAKSLYDISPYLYIGIVKILSVLCILILFPLALVFFLFWDGLGKVQDTYYYFIYEEKRHLNFLFSKTEFKI